MHTYTDPLGRRKHIYPILAAVEPEEAYYEQVRGMVKILNYVIETDVDDEIPPTGLVREFVGGNTFYKQLRNPLLELKRLEA